jgi:outer membrane protein OmpA-like peptidoglycan-associated protein
MIVMRSVLLSAYLVSACATVNTVAVLLPEESAAPTAIAVESGGRTVVLDAPLSGVAVDTRGNVEKVSFSTDQVNQTFGAALSAQPPPAVSFRLYFETNSSEVSAASRADLDALLQEVARRDVVEVQVTGHTDRVGTIDDNDRLSLQRAEAVRTMLIQRGIRATFTRAVGRGEREPLVPTPDEQPEARNRRVEVIVR